MLEKLWKACKIQPGCEDKPPSYWSNALQGEAGEFGNWIKKHDRGRGDYNEMKAQGEHADIFIYWVLMAKRMGWSLEEVVIMIFNTLTEVESKYAKSKENDIPA